MLPSLTAARRRVTPRVGLAAVSGIFALAALASIPAASPAAPASLADTLSPSTWAMAVPSAWLASTPSGIQAGDHVDLLAMRSGDRAYALPIAFGLRVMSVDAQALVLEVDEDDAIAIATARSGGLAVVPILRSTR